MKEKTENAEEQSGINFYNYKLIQFETKDRFSFVEKSINKRCDIDNIISEFRKDVLDKCDSNSTIIKDDKTEYKKMTNLWISHYSLELEKLFKKSLLS